MKEAADIHVWGNVLTFPHAFRTYCFLSFRPHYMSVRIN